MHWLTLVFVFIETIFFFIQVYDLFRYPQRRKQWWDLILLGLLVKYNLFNGLFPDASFRLDIRVQYMIAYGLAYLTGAYFPFYFYKMYGLKSLRWWVTWGVLFFTLLPYLVWDVVLYSLNGHLVIDREWGVVVPGIYGSLLLFQMFRAVMVQYEKKHDPVLLRCELIVWVGILPWQAMIFFAFYPVTQWVQILMANIGWIAIILMKLTKDVHFSRKAFRELMEFKETGGLNSVFDAKCVKYQLTPREIEIARLLKIGHTYRQIGDKLFISEHTVDNHVRNIYQKVGVSNKFELIHKLWND